MIEQPTLDAEAETLVLTGLLMGRDNPRLVSEHFAIPGNRAVFDTIRGLQSDDIPIDPTTVQRQLNGDQGMRDGYFAAMGHFGDSVPFDHFCDLLEDRRIHRAKLTILKSDLPVGETIERLVRLADEGLRVNGLRTFRQACADYVGLMERVANGEERTKTISTGFARLDQMTRGLEEARLWVIGARPRIGKTSMLCALASNAAMTTTLPIPFFSLEMTESQWTARMISMRARVDSGRLRRARLSQIDKARIEEVLKAETGLLINDRAGITPADIRESLLSLPSPPAAVFVDYLQKLKAGTSKRRAENRQIEVGDISRALKDISKEFRIPVIVAAQINREGAGRPKIEHLRESGDIESEADIIALLHRREPTDDQDPTALQEIDFIIDKQRDGPEGVIPMTFEPTTTRFVEIPE